MNKWIEIDLSAIEHNYKLIRNTVRSGVKILGVVKADGYGHGLVEVAKELELQGIDYLGVTEIDEGLQLRQQGIKKPILVFGPPLIEDLTVAQDHDLTITLGDLTTLKYLKENNLELKVHLKLETGLGRTGFKLGDLEEVCNLINNSQIQIEGVYTHLATAKWANPSFVKEQFAQFSKATEFLKQRGMTIGLCHICNSEALVKYPEMHLDMVRAGNILYGHGGGKLAQELQNPWTLKAKITYITHLPKGHSVGYERSYFLPRDAKIAILPIGIFHGYSIEPIVRSNSISDLIRAVGKLILRYFNHPLTRTYVTINGSQVPVIGKVGMQQTILDVTQLNEVNVGDVVELTGRRINISPLLPQLYFKEGQIIKIRRLKEEIEGVKLAAK
ncbi:MAG: alanine racemase [Clostridia bacterium]|jgi:alanine racemase|nr:alanine racemase [Clostridia bacterium]